MKPAGLPLFALVLTGASLDAAEPAGATPARTSARLAREIHASLPKYEPPPPSRPPRDFSGDADLFALPKVTVTEKPPPRVDAAELLSRRELEKKLAKQYRDSLASGLEAFLNRFPIPLFSASPAERGKSLEERRKFDDAYRIADLRRQLDPDEAERLKADLTQTERDIEWRQRPAGDGRKK